MALLRPPYSNSICGVKTGATRDFRLVFVRLKATGLLLESDQKLPSVCALIAGEPLSGSWWSHPRAHRIFRVTAALADDPEVLITKLISGKVTFVHKSLWPEVVSLGAARDTWQTKRLSTTTRQLLEIIDTSGAIRTDSIAWPKTTSTKPGQAARELESRLLVHSEEIHTESGAHAKLLETWEHWTARTGFKRVGLPLDRAKQTLESRLASLNEAFGASGRLPWQSASLKPTKSHGLLR